MNQPTEKAVRFVSGVAPSPMRTRIVKNPIKTCIVLNKDVSSGTSGVTIKIALQSTACGLVYSTPY